MPSEQYIVNFTDKCKPDSFLFKVWIELLASVSFFCSKGLLDSVAILEKERRSKEPCHSFTNQGFSTQSVIPVYSEDYFTWVEFFYSYPILKNINIAGILRLSSTSNSGQTVLLTVQVPNFVQGMVYLTAGLSWVGYHGYKAIDFFPSNAKASITIVNLLLS